MNPAAWLGWLVAVGIYAFVVTNPLCVLLALGAVLMVGLSRPRDGSPVRVFITAGLVLLVLRLVLVAVASNPGQTELFRLPRLTLPGWAGSFSLGGAVTAEVLVEEAGEGLRLLVVLVAFGAFNASVDMASLARRVPAGMRDAGLVVSIALGFVPGLLRTVSDVRDAQRLRDERGLRRLAPSLAVPVLGMSLDRAFLLAESMDARGYGRGVHARRPLTLPALCSLVAGVAVWSAGWETAALVLLLAGAAGLVYSLGGWGRTARIDRRPWSAWGVCVVVASAAAVALAVSAGEGASYTAYPVAGAPVFPPLAGLGAVVLSAPAFARDE